jgi:hypothetical protein
MLAGKGGARRISCDECEDEWHPEPPPCDTCERPELMAANRTAYEIWAVCSTNGRLPSFGGIGPIAASEVIAVTRDLFDGCRSDAMKALRFDGYFLRRYHQRKEQEPKQRN